MQTDSAPTNAGDCQITLGTPSNYKNFPCSSRVKAEPRILIEKRVCWPYVSSSLSPVMFPRYAEYQARLNSFKGWPCQHSQTPKEMADSGFFHSAVLGKPDRVTCHYCGLTLFEWIKDEKPNVSHVNFSYDVLGSECTFVKSILGEQIVRKC